MGVMRQEGCTSVFKLLECAMRSEDCGDEAGRLLGGDRKTAGMRLEDYWKEIRRPHGQTERLWGWDRKTTAGSYWDETRKLLG